MDGLAAGQRRSRRTASTTTRSGAGRRPARRRRARHRAVAGDRADWERRSRPSCPARRERRPTTPARETFLTKYGQRLFRRPLTTRGADRYLSFFDASKTKSDFKTALKWMTVALIQSPNALYRSEIGTDSGAARAADAPTRSRPSWPTRYTGTTPSDALLTMAGAARTWATVAARAQTMLATDAGQAGAAALLRAVPGLRQRHRRSRSRTSRRSRRSARDMVQETRAFIDQTSCCTRAGGLKELLTATTTNPSKALASYYATGNVYTGGFPTPAPDYASVTAPGGHGRRRARAGRVPGDARRRPTRHRRPSAASSRTTGCSASRKLTPPPNVPPLDTTPMTGRRTRPATAYEKLHASGQAAAACHKQFDPLGFGFEHFDEGGRYRAKEKTSTSTRRPLSPRPTATTLHFTGEEDLMTRRREPADRSTSASRPTSPPTPSAATRPASAPSQVTDLQSGRSASPRRSRAWPASRTSRSETASSRQEFRQETSSEDFVGRLRRLAEPAAEAEAVLALVRAVLAHTFRRSSGTATASRGGPPRSSRWRPWRRPGRPKTR